MPTQGTNGIGGATKHIADHALAIAKLELRLALLELKKKAAVLGVGVGLLVGAAVFGLFALGFILAAAAAGLATTLSMWLALLIVGAVLLVLAGVLALLGRSSVKRGVPPVPEQAITEAKVTKEAVKANGSRRTGS
jgi:membrane protein implicated in regulation of membrane protease activity